MSSNGALDLTIRIMGKVDPSLAKSISSVTRQAGSISNVIGVIGKTGLAMTGAVAAASAAVIASTTKAAETFESQMADVAKYVDGITDATGHIDVSKYNEMSDAILRLSTMIPYTAEELTQLAAAAGESGYGFDEIVRIANDGTISGFLYDVAMAGSALDISAEQAGDWAAKWEVALNMSHEQVMDLFDQINFLAANTATSAAEIAEVVNKTGSVGNIAGMSPSYTAALADALLSMGVDSARAATSVKNIYTNMSLGASATDRMESGWARIGMSAEAVAAAMQVDAPGTMKEVFGAIGALPDEQRLATISDIFGRWPLESAAKVAENMQAFQDAIEMVEGTGWQGSLGREFIVKSGTSEALGQMFDSSVNRFMVTLGNNFLPVKKELATLGIDMMNGITDSLPDLTRLAESVMPLLRNAVEGIGNAVKQALPYIQSAVDYATENGDQVAQWATGLVGVFALMSAAPTISGVVSTLMGPAADLFSVSPGRGQGVSNAASRVVSGIGKTAGAAVFGAQMANSSMTMVNGESGGLMQTIANGALGALFGLKNRDTLMNGKGSDRTWWTRALGVADQITAAKEGGLGGVVSGLFSGTGIGNYAKSIAGTKVGGGLIGAAKGIGGVTKEILLGISDYTGLTGAATGITGAGSYLLSKIGAAAPVQAAGKGVGAIAGGIGNVLSFGGTVLGPFMSLLGMFGPIIAGLGGIVAIVSILGDNLDSIRTIVGNIFGPTGVQVFDQFVAGITNIGTAIQNTLSPEGLANIQQAITNVFGPGAGEAFGTVIPLIQTVTGLFGQIVDLGVNHIKPLLVEVFGYLSETLFPAVIPLLSTVIGLVGTTLVNAVKLIVDVVKTVTPAVEPVITGIVGLIQGIASTAVSVVNFIIRALNGLSFTVPEWLKDVPLAGQFAGKTFGFNLQEVTLPQFAQGGLATRPSIFGEDGPEMAIPLSGGKRDRAVELWAKTGKMLGVTALAGIALGSDAGVAFTQGVGLMNRIADVMALTGADNNLTRQFTSVARSGAALRGQLGYIASADGLSLPNLAPRRTSSGSTETAPKITFAPQISVNGSMSEEDINRLVELLYRKFAEFMDRYERERRRTSYAR